ncbi:hypothetical protein DFH27DRAFT_645461 [Peziza echinospora]|nr:hypothetical protein DFH27DRAFT_645461 [Peziza echinospora]
MPGIESDEGTGPGRDWAVGSPPPPPPARSSSAPIEVLAPRPAILLTAAADAVVPVVPSPAVDSLDCTRTIYLYSGSTVITGEYLVDHGVVTSDTFAGELAAHSVVTTETFADELAETGVITKTTLGDELCEKGVITKTTLPDELTAAGVVKESEFATLLKTLQTLTLTLAKQ